MDALQIINQVNEVAEIKERNSKLLLQMHHSDSLDTFRNKSTVI